METETRRLVRMIMSALSSGIIAAGGVLLGAVTSDGNIKPGTWVLAGVTGTVALFKDIQAGLSSPPIAAVHLAQQTGLVDSGGKPVKP